MRPRREIDDDAHKRLLGLEYNARLHLVVPLDFGAVSGTSKVFVYQLRVDGAAGGDRIRARGVAKPAPEQAPTLESRMLVGEGTVFLGEAIRGGYDLLRGASYCVRAM